jgi:hypothetical protein
MENVRMLLSGVAEMALMVILIGAVWLTGAVIIKAAEQVERRKAAALARSRPFKGRSVLKGA